MEEKCWIGRMLKLNFNICENGKNFKIDAEYLFLLEYKSLKVKNKIKDFNTWKRLQVSQNSICHWVFKLLKKMYRPS